MQSYHANLGAGLEGLLLKEHDVPVPGTGEMLVRVQACSLNFRELMILFLGYYPLPIRPDVIPAADGAGDVVAIGEGVTRVKVGDRVMGAPFPYWLDGPFEQKTSDQLGGSLNGMLTEYALLPEEGVVHIPDHLSFEEAAAFPCAGLTAWNALFGGQSLQAGDTVLTLGSGGVSLFALQFAKAIGARVIATTSSEEKAERLKGLGADEVINYHTTPDWHLAVRELTDGRGVDKVVEVGGPGTIVQSIKSTRFEGEVALIGSVAKNGSANSNGTIYNAAIMGVTRLRTIAVGSCTQFRSMNQLITANRLRPVIDRVFPFEETKAAYQYYQKSQSFGKVIINHP